MNEIFDWFIDLALKVDETLEAVQHVSLIIYYYVLGSGIAIGIIFVLVVAVIANQHKASRKVDQIIGMLEEGEIDE